MTYRQAKGTTGVQLMLRAFGVAVASIVMFLVLAALGGGAHSAEARALPPGRGDVPGDGPAGPRSTPVMASVDHAAAPVIEPATQQVPDAAAPEVEPVTDPLAAVVEREHGNERSAEKKPAAVGPASVVKEKLDATATPPDVETVLAPVADATVPPAAPVDGAATNNLAPQGPPAGKPDHPAHVDRPTHTDNTSHTGHTGHTGHTLGPSAIDQIRSEPEDTTAARITPSAPAPVADGHHTPSAPVVDDVAVEMPAGRVVDPAVESAAPAASYDSATTPVLVGSVSGTGVVDDVDTRHSSNVATAARRSTSSAPAPFPARPTGVLPGFVSGMLSDVASSSSSGAGAPSVMLAVLAAAVTAMFILSSRVTVEVSWRSVLVPTSIERPG